jgi:hypothetical protein
VKMRVQERLGGALIDAIKVTPDRTVHQINGPRDVMTWPGIQDLNGVALRTLRLWSEGPCVHSERPARTV